MTRYRVAFLGISAPIFFVLGVVQMYLAGSGVFHGGDLFADTNTFMEPHRMLGESLALVALIVVIAAAVTRNRAFIVVSIIALILTGVTGMIASAGANSPWLGGLHVLVGLIIVGLSGWLAHRSAKAMRTAKDVTAI